MEKLKIVSDATMNIISQDIINNLKHIHIAVDNIYLKQINYNHTKLKCLILF